MWYRTVSVHVLVWTALTNTLLIINNSRFLKKLHGAFRHQQSLEEIIFVQIADWNLNDMTNLTKQYLSNKYLNNLSLNMSRFCGFVVASAESSSGQDSHTTTQGQTFTFPSKTDRLQWLHHLWRAPNSVLTFYCLLFNIRGYVYVYK